jgi:hypothetical protein
VAAISIVIARDEISIVTFTKGGGIPLIIDVVWIFVCNTDMTVVVIATGSVDETRIVTLNGSQWHSTRSIIE